MTRLLICRDCRTIEELPDYDGPVDYDVLLDHAVEAHKFPNGEAHFGNLATVSDEQWRNESTRQQIIAQIRSKTTGLESEYYATKNTFEADAIACYNKHRRPDEGCIDWKIDKKRLGNPTKVGWQAGPKVYLCDFCPCKSWVKTQERWQQGLYK